MIQLRDGSYTSDIRLDRLVNFDEKSRAYDIAELDLNQTLRGRSWPLDNKVRIDQRRQGACVSFSWTNELLGQPVPIKFLSIEAAESFARMNYWEMQKIDPWQGGSYPGASPVYEGTDVLSGAKIMQKHGFIGEYRWAFNIDDVLRTLAHFGPVIFGTYWLNSMFEPRPSGLLEVNPSQGDAGGHAYAGRGLIMQPRLKGESPRIGPVVRVPNTWGPDWGINGECFIKVSDLEYLLNRDGECCIPVQRHKINPTIL